MQEGLDHCGNILFILPKIKTPATFMKQEFNILGLGHFYNFIFLVIVSENSLQSIY